MNYWDNAAARIIVARQHTKEMSELYSGDIKKCISITKTYDENFILEGSTVFEAGKTLLIDIDSVSAIFLAREALPDQKIAVVNFSSFVDPGGMFLKGSKAQEECLCHESILYNVLSDLALQSFYQLNRKDKNQGLYYNRALYLPDILFIRDNKQCRADVITCAAPNLNYAYKYSSINKMQIKKLARDTMESRIKFIRDIAIANNVHTLIFGAYGCGVFKNDPYVVAALSKDIFAASNINICYAILDKNSYNYKAFASVLG